MIVKTLVESFEMTTSGALLMVQHELVGVDNL